MTELVLAHLSVKDYLTSSSIQSGSASRFAIQQESASAYIAETCLAYLLQFNHEDIVLKETLPEFPLALYAAKCWPEHAREANERSDLLIDLAVQLCRAHTKTFDNFLYLFEWRGTQTTFMRDENCPPLYIASLCGLPRLAKILIDQKADVNYQSRLLGSAWQAASKGGYKDIAHMLVSSGAETNAVEIISGTPLSDQDFSWTLRMSSAAIRRERERYDLYVQEI